MPQDHLKNTDISAKRVHILVRISEPIIFTHDAQIPERNELVAMLLLAYKGIVYEYFTRPSSIGFWRIVPVASFAAFLKSINYASQVATMSFRTMR